jgi:hypothetical protein
MGTDKMDRSFPCLCGKGEMLAEWSEHDTWPSPNRSIGWSFQCPDCEAKYVFAGIWTEIILRTDAEKLAELASESEAAKAKVYEVAGPRYEERWVKFVASQGTKKEQNRLIGSGSYGTFLKYASRPGWIEYKSKLRFQVAPKKCLDQMNVADPEVSALHEAAVAAQRATDDFWHSIEKKAVPLH